MASSVSVEVPSTEVQASVKCRRILLLSWELPPSPSGAAVVVGNLARQFGRDEMIITGEKPSTTLPLKWQEDWPRIYYVLGRWPRGLKGRNLRTRLLLPLIVARCLWLAWRHQCNTIVVIFPKETFLTAAYLTAKITGSTFYPYFHNTYLENRRGASRLFAQWLQPRIFKAADKVLVMSDAMSELYRERYPNVKTYPLVHSFNGPIPHFEPLATPGSPLRLLIAGSIHASCLDATLRFCDALSKVANSELTFLSGASRAYLEKLGVLRPGWHHSTVPEEKYLSHLRQADILVLPHGFTGGYSDEEYRTIFPTRLIEYLISGRPILVHAPPDCFLSRFIKEHGCALLVDTPSVIALIEAIERLRTDAALREDVVRHALRTAEMFHAPQVARTFRHYLQ